MKFVLVLCIFALLTVNLLADDLADNSAPASAADDSASSLLKPNNNELIVNLNS